MNLYKKLLFYTCFLLFLSNTTRVLAQAEVIAPASGMKEVDAEQKKLTFGEEVVDSSVLQSKESKDQLYWSSRIGSKDPRLEGVDIGELLDAQNIVVPVAKYQYASFGKEDPFVPPYEQLAQQRTVDLEVPIVSPLQVNLASLRVGGVWELDDGTRRALVLTKSGEGIVAGIGDPIGPSGKIVDISELGLIARQYRVRPDGSREYQDISLSFGASSTFSMENTSTSADISTPSSAVAQPEPEVNIGQPSAMQSKPTVDTPPATPPPVIQRAVVPNFLRAN